MLIVSMQSRYRITVMKAFESLATSFILCDKKIWVWWQLSICNWKEEKMENEMNKPHHPSTSCRLLDQPLIKGRPTSSMISIVHYWFTVEICIVGGNRRSERLSRFSTFVTAVLAHVNDYLPKTGLPGGKVGPLNRPAQIPCLDDRKMLCDSATSQSCSNRYRSTQRMSMSPLQRCATDLC